MTADEVAAKIGGGREKREGTRWRMPCPAHPDHTPSLDVSEGRDGRVMVMCRAGCELEAILVAGGVDWSDLFSEASTRPERDDNWTPAGRAVARYAYTDEAGKLLFEVVRAESKRFLQRRPDPSRESGWIWKLGDIRRPLYRLPEVLAAAGLGQTIYVCEGEKDVEAVRATGATGTCNPHGAGKWRPEHTETLREADVVVIADRDEPGYKHARAVAKALAGVASRVRVVQPEVGKDAYDHLQAGRTLETLVALTVEEARSLMAEDVLDFLEGETAFDWVVEGLLERGDRLILTGFEGQGKTTLIRQLAVCCAAGIHPFTYRPLPPVRVLLIDCENGERLTRRRLRDLIETARKTVEFPRDQLYLVCRPGGLDLTDSDDSSWLFEQVTAFRPDIVFIGPLYQLHSTNPNDEQPARTVAGVLQQVTVRGRCALVTEAHAGKAEGATGRHVRPIGSSVWLRWPEFGYGLLPMKGVAGLVFQSWRGPRDERAWPESLERSSPWPWRGVYKPVKSAVTPIRRPIRDFYEVDREKEAEGGSRARELSMYDDEEEAF